LGFFLFIIAIIFYAGKRYRKFNEKREILEVGG